MVNSYEPFDVRPVFIVLTIGHLDHDPTSRDRGNLKALCQRCHLRYDAQHHADTARATRNKRKYEKQGSLLEGL
jgi:hypothetical protein